MMSERSNSESDHAVDTPLNIEALVNCLAAQPDVLAAYLFGSYAAGRARPESDGDFDAFAWAIVDYLTPQTSTGQSESEQR